MTLRYSTSRLAALLGHFGAAQRLDAIMEVWQRAAPDSLRRAIERNTANPSAQLLQVEIPQAVQEVLSKPCATPKEVAERKVQVRKAIKASIPPPDPSAPWLTTSPVQAALVQHCEREVNTTFGTAMESPVIERFSAQYGQPVRADQTLYNRRYGQLIVQGRVDGRFPDGRVLEVKNRVRGLFRTLRNYERLQILTYLELCDAPSAILCEAYVQEINWIEVKRDSDWWNAQVLQPLQMLDQELHQLFVDEEKQDALLSS